MYFFLANLVVIQLFSRCIGLVSIIFLGMSVAACTKHKAKAPPRLGPFPSIEDRQEVPPPPEPSTQQPAPQPVNPIQKPLTLVTSRDDLAKVLPPSLLTTLVAEADKTQIVVTSDPPLIQWRSFLSSIRDSNDLRFNVTVPEGTTQLKLTIKIILSDQKELLVATEVVNPQSPEKRLQINWQQQAIPEENPQPAPAPIPRPFASPTINQWDGKSDQGGPDWSIQAAP